MHAIAHAAAIAASHRGAPEATATEAAATAETAATASSHTAATAAATRIRVIRHDENCGHADGSPQDQAL
jgi:hypothetical protein